MRKVHVVVYRDGTRPHYYAIRDEDEVSIPNVQAMAICVNAYGAPFTVDMVFNDGRSEAALLGSLTCQVCG